MLRGYDSLKEIHQWGLVAYLLGGVMMLVSISLSPLFDNLLFMSYNVSFFVGFILFYVVISILSPLFSSIGYRREKRKRDALRQAALKKDLSLLAPYQPSAISASSLPLQIELKPKLKLLSLVKWTISGLLTAFAFIVSYIAIVYGFWIMPFYLLMVAMVFGVLMPNSSLSFARTVKQQLVRRSLYPSLSINDNGIIARYGRETITMRWQDARYFALTSSAALVKDLTPTGAFKREVYELCDGENIICWLAASFLEEDRLLRSGSVAFSDWDRQTEPLASLIVAKTGLPLYDLRLPAQKRASQQRERAMSSARRG